MARWDTFTFRVNSEDKRLVAILAERLQRSQSDAIRFVVRLAVNSLNDKSMCREEMKKSSSILQDVSHEQ